MSFQGQITPGIVEKLYLLQSEDGYHVMFRNYSVNNTIVNLGATVPVSVKWGVKDNHFFVQTGSGASAIFYIYTLDRAAEGAIYQPGIIPTATLVKTLPMAALNVTVCTATFNFSKSGAFAVYAYQISRAYLVAPFWTSEWSTVDLPNDSSLSKVTTFVLNATLLETPNAFGGWGGTVSATANLDQAVLDGELNLLIPFQLSWSSGWRPFDGTEGPSYAGTSYYTPNCGPAPPSVDQGSGIPESGSGFIFANEKHALIINLGANIRVYATLPATVTRTQSVSGRRISPTSQGIYHDHLNTYDVPPIHECSAGAVNQPVITNYAMGSLGRRGTTETQPFLYTEAFPFVSIADLMETVDTPESYNAAMSGVWPFKYLSWNGIVTDQVKRWFLQTEIIPLSGRRSSGPLSGNLVAAVLHVTQQPTNAIAAWAADVKKDGWFLLRGAGLGFDTTLVSMQVDAPAVTVMSANQKYLLWTIPGYVYRTTLTTGNTIEVGTDPTKFTSRQLTLIHPTYLYSQAETWDDEGIEGHFFVDIKSTPLPTTDLPVPGSLVKWAMFNPVDDLKHL